MKSETTFIYALCEPYPNQHKIRYVGKADDPYRRYEEHCNNSHRALTYKDRWVQKLQSEGKEPQLEVLEEVPAVEWQEIEREYVRVFRAIGFRLTNTAEGGIGGSGGQQSPEHVAKRIAHRVGKPLSTETRMKIATALMGRKGKKHTPEQRTKISVGQIGNKRSPETGIKLGQIAQGAKRNKTTISIYVGVTRDLGRSKWRAQISFRGKPRRLGSFATEEAAARAYDLAARELFGPKARTNF